MKRTSIKRRAVQDLAFGVMGTLLIGMLACTNEPVPVLNPPGENADPSVKTDRSIKTEPPVKVVETISSTNVEPATTETAGKPIAKAPAEEPTKKTVDPNPDPKQSPDPVDEKTPKTVEKTPAKAHKANRLAKEKSPYLLQHKNNPVDWHPWGEEAFALAKKDNKPIFLSIGYSTCHWCHVMERESFEDEEVAGLMNEAFVCIKVDREERPDIDNIYMQVCQIMTQSGGWPLTVIMTPEKKPFFAGTYFPKTTRQGRVGMLDLVPRVATVWKNERDTLVKHGDQITDILVRFAQPAPGRGEPLGEPALKLGFEQLAERFDPIRGGFGTAPKFPTPHNLLFLLRYWKRTGEPRALEVVEKTLTAMRYGGIYDHVGFGFHRYSTDADWLVPHFEKMLYDQALLAMAYTEAFQATGKPEYQQTAREIFTYVLRDMTSPDGGFYSAEDADSEGEEGKFYVWKDAELDEHLDREQAALVRATFNFTKEGNYREQLTGSPNGTNIPHLAFAPELAGEKPEPEKADPEKPKTPEKPAAVKPDAGKPDAGKQEAAKQWEAARQKLFAVRELRVHPHKDDKILTDWNGLMIAALAKAGRAFDEPAYSRAATRAADFLLTTLRDDKGRLKHRFRDGEGALAATVDDYAFFSWGLIELYETTLDVRHLKTAVALNDDLLKHFWDEAGGGLYFTADDAEELLVRQKEIHDGAVPAGNSVAMLNLLRLGRMTGREAYGASAARVAAAFSQGAQRAPAGHTFLMQAVDFTAGPSFEVVIAGAPDALDTREMLAALHKAYLPNKVVLFRPSDVEAPPIVELAPFTQLQTSKGGKATAYVCENYQCNLPTVEIPKMLELLTPKPLAKPPEEEKKE